MSSPLIPMNLDEWDMPTLEKLIKLRDIERETFDFKGPEFEKLYEHLCAFANYPGGGIIVLGIKPIKPKKIVIGFRKVGFRSKKEDWIRDELNNQMAIVDPIPKVTPKILADENDNRLYPVLKIEGDEVQRPYLVKKKDGPQCLVRIGASSSPASRATILYLFSDLITKRNNVERLRSSAGFLKEELIHACENIRDIDPSDYNEKLLPVDLTYVRNAALPAERFLAQNELLGGHQDINSFTAGFYSFAREIDRLNSLINWYNTGNDTHKKYVKQTKMQFWEPKAQDYEKSVGYLNKLIIKCDEFLSQFQ
jgi:Putative DNA-binding domain